MSNYSTAQTSPLSLDTAGNLRVSTGTVTVAALPAGTNKIGLAQLTTGTSGGVGTLTRFHSTSVATGFSKASSGVVYFIDLFNTTAAIRYFHIYNKVSAPTLGTDTPIMSIGIGASAKAQFLWPVGVTCTTGIAFAITTDDVAIPVTAATAGDIQGTLGYA